MHIALEGGETKVQGGDLKTGEAQHERNWLWDNHRKRTGKKG